MKIGEKIKNMNKKDLELISEDIRNLLEQRRRDLELTFVEENHIYFMKDFDGKIKSNFPSVSEIIKKFYKPFDDKSVSLRMSNGDDEGARRLQEQWRQAGELAANMGSRVHYELEMESLRKFKFQKEVRSPLFTINEVQQSKSDYMIAAGKEFLDLMDKRGAVLLETEIVLGSPEIKMTGQADTAWLMMNKDKTDFGIVISDYKTNQPKNFKVHRYTGKLYHPFSNYHDNALGHYYIQLPLYGKLIKAMLQGTEYENINLLGNIVVLLKEDGTFEEFRVPKPISDTILKMDLSKY